jgi:hypothetical protein
MRSTLILLLVVASPAIAQESVPSLLAKIKAVGKEGKGNAAAAAAWKGLVQHGPDALIDVLAGLDDTSPVAANWVRAAVDAIADNTLASGKRLPADRLEAFVKNVKHSGAGRKLAYDWLSRVDPAAADRLLPGMADDPGAELRREAVAVLLKNAEEALDKGTNKAAAIAAFQKVLQHARDADQVQKAAGELKGLGIEVDLTRHFGFVTHWQLVGPFNNVGGVGFAASYPPEKGFIAAAAFEGKDKAKVAWKEHVSDLPMGLVDLNKIYGKLKGAVAYAYAAVDSPVEQPVELRAGSFNAVRIYLNGKEVYFREEYHHGMTMDQHIGKGTLKAGKNEILVKVCQNEQTESWAQSWSFQLRVCDRLGAPAPLTVIDVKK